MCMERVQEFLESTASTLIGDLRTIKEEQEAPSSPSSRVSMESRQSSSCRRSLSVANSFDTVDRRRVFTPAVVEVTALLESTFRQFKFSPEYSALVNGEPSSPITQIVIMDTTSAGGGNTPPASLV